MTGDLTVAIVKIFNHVFLPVIDISVIFTLIAVLHSPMTAPLYFVNML